MPTQENVGGANYCMELFNINNVNLLALGRGRDDDY